MDKEIILYTSGCPQCKVLEAKLDQKGVQYQKVEDVEVMLAKDITHVPVLEIEGKLYSFKESLAWVNSRGDNE